MTAPALLDRLLEQLGEVRERCPELRFGQLIAIIGELAQDETGHSLWDVEDADFAAALRRFAQDMARRASDRAEAGAAQRLHRMLIKKLYSDRILNNSHRGDFVEMMVLEALGPEWRHVGLGWNVWDLQRGKGAERARIQVKQCAALQRWGKTKRMIFQFPWSDRAPAYIRRDFPNEPLEEDGWFCELFVVGVHAVEDKDACDQTDPSQWQFMIVPSCELKRGQNSMTLSKAIKRWPLVSLAGLKSAVEIQLSEGRVAG